MFPYWADDDLLRNEQQMKNIKDHADMLAYASQEGERQGKLAVAKAMLAKRFSVELRRIAGLSDQDLLRLLSAVTGE